MEIITIHIEGGIIQDVNGIPAGVQIQVNDFDVASEDIGNPMWNILQNENGRHFEQAIWDSQE